MNPKFTYGASIFAIEYTTEERIDQFMEELKKVDADLEALSNMPISTETLKAACNDLARHRKSIITSLHLLIDEL